MATGRAANFYTFNSNMHKYTLVAGASASSPVTVSGLSADDILLSCIEYNLPAIDADGWKAATITGGATNATLTLTGYTPATDTLVEIWEQDGVTGQLSLVTSHATLATNNSFKLDYDTTGDAIHVRWLDYSEIEQPSVVDRSAVTSFTNGYVVVSVDTTGSKLGLSYLDVSASEL